MGDRIKGSAIWKCNSRCVRDVSHCACFIGFCSGCQVIAGSDGCYIKFFWLSSNKLTNLPTEIFEHIVQSFAMIPIISIADFIEFEHSLHLKLFRPWQPFSPNFLWMIICTTLIFSFQNDICRVLWSDPICLIIWNKWCRQNQTQSNFGETRKSEQANTPIRNFEPRIQKRYWETLGSFFQSFSFYCFWTKFQLYV